MLALELVVFVCLFEVDRQILCLSGFDFDDWCLQGSKVSIFVDFVVVVCSVLICLFFFFLKALALD